MFFFYYIFLKSRTILISNRPSHKTRHQITFQNYDYKTLKKFNLFQKIPSLLIFIPIVLSQINNLE